MFNHALLNADLKELDRVLYATAPEDQQMLSAMEDVMRSVAALKEAVAAKFGQEGAAKVAELGMGGFNGGAFDNAESQIDGDHATVVIQAGHRSGTFDLIKVNGEWRIPMEGLMAPHETTPTVRKKFIDNLQKQQKRLDALLADVKSGKAATIEEVKAELRGK